MINNTQIAISRAEVEDLKVARRIVVLRYGEDGAKTTQVYRTLCDLIQRWENKSKYENFKGNENRTNRG